VKLTLSVLMFIGLAVITLQGTPAGAQANGGSTFKVVPTPNGNKFNSGIFAASASSPTDIWGGRKLDDALQRHQVDSFPRAID